MTAVHFTTIPCKPYTANRHIVIFFAKFVAVLRTLFMLGLKFLELFYAF